MASVLRSKLDFHPVTRVCFEPEFDLCRMSGKVNCNRVTESTPINVHQQCGTLRRHMTVDLVTCNILISQGGAQPEDLLPLNVSYFSHLQRKQTSIC